MKTVDCSCGWNVVVECDGKQITVRCERCGDYAGTTRERGETERQQLERTIKMWNEIVNLECECGGTYEVVRPIKTDISTETVLHRCNRCKGEIYVDGIYPGTTAISDSESEPYGMKDAFTLEERYN